MVLPSWRSQLESWPSDLSTYRSRQLPSIPRASAMSTQTGSRVATPCGKLGLDGILTTDAHPAWTLQLRWRTPPGTAKGTWYDVQARLRQSGVDGELAHRERGTGTQFPCPLWWFIFTMCRGTSSPGEQADMSVAAPWPAEQLLCLGEHVPAVNGPTCRSRFPSQLSRHTPG